MFKDEITHRFEVELQTHKEEIINFHRQIEDTKSSYDRIIDNLQLQHEELLKQKRREMDTTLRERGLVLDQRVQLLEQELRSRLELSKEHQSQLETLSGMLDEAKDKEVQKNNKISELTKLLSDEVNRNDKLREQIRNLEEEIQGNSTFV